MQKIKDYALALAAMVAGVTMGYVIFGLIIYICGGFNPASAKN